MEHRRNNHSHDGAFGGALIAFVLTLLTAKLVWGWLVPTLFAGAVASGAVVAALPWSSAALIAAVVAIVVFAARHQRRRAHQGDNPVKDAARA